MPPPPPNSLPRPPRNGAAPGPPPAAEVANLEELITEAEAIRSVLGETHARLGRLLAALKQHRRRNRAVEAAIASLRELGHTGR